MPWPVIAAAAISAISQYMASRNKNKGSGAGEDMAGLTGSLVGGYLANKYTGPSTEAGTAVTSLMDTSRRASDASTAYGDFSPGFLAKANEGIDRGRYYLGEAGTSARNVPNLMGVAQGQFDRAEAAVEPARSYYTGVLGGGPDAMEAIAPEVAALQGQFENVRSSTSQFAPRGGGRAATLSELPFRKASGITNLMSQARRDAAAHLPEVAQTLTQIGLGRTNIAGLGVELADLQRRIGATEAEIGIEAGKLGISAGQLQALLLSVSQQGAEAILRFDIANRALVYEHVKEATKAGGDAGRSFWGIIKKIATWGAAGGKKEDQGVAADNTVPVDDLALGGGDYVGGE